MDKKPQLELDPDEHKAREMVVQAGLEVKACYRTNEVCRILNVSPKKVWQMTNEYEPDPRTGKPVKPNTLDSFIFGTHRRIPFYTIVDLLRRNRTYDLKNRLA